jgi:hypothetical protein
MQKNPETMAVERYSPQKQTCQKRSAFVEETVIIDITHRTERVE